MGDLLHYMLKLLGFVTILQEARPPEPFRMEILLQCRSDLFWGIFAEKGFNCFLYEDFLQSDSGPVPMSEVYKYRKVVDTCEFSTPNLIRYNQIKQWSSGTVFGIWGQAFHVRYQ